MAQKRPLTARAQAPRPGVGTAGAVLSAHPRFSLAQSENFYPPPPSAHTQPSEKNKKMPIRFVDIPSLPPVPAAAVRTRSRCAESADTPAARAPSDRGTNLVTREEYEALLARVVALESVTRNVTLPAKPAARPVAVTGVTRNASNAKRQRRYRERVAAKKNKTVP